MKENEEDIPELCRQLEELQVNVTEASNSKETEALKDRMQDFSEYAGSTQ